MSKGIEERGRPAQQAPPLGVVINCPVSMSATHPPSPPPSCASTQGVTFPLPVDRNAQYALPLSWRPVARKLPRTESEPKKSRGIEQ